MGRAVRSWSMSGDEGLFAGTGVQGVMSPKANFFGQESDMFGFKDLNQYSDESIAGEYWMDGMGQEYWMQGLGQEAMWIDGLGQATGGDLFAQINDPLVEKAKRYLAEFAKLQSIVPNLPSSDQRAKANAIINDKWHPKIGLAFWRKGKYDLNQLARMIAIYAAEKMGQFVRIGRDLSISRSREERLNNFVRGVKELRKYMKQFLVMPTEMIDTSAEILIATARSAAAKARSTRNPGDVAGALAAAESARESALPQGKDDIVREANALVDEMTALAKQVGMPAAGQSYTDTRETEEKPTDDLTTYLLIGAAGIAAVGLIVLLTKKG